MILRVIAVALLIVLCSQIRAVAQVPNNLSPKEVEKYYGNYPYLENKGKVFSAESEFRIPDGFKRLPDGKMSKYQAWVSQMPLWHYEKGVATLGQGVAFEAHEISRCVMFPWRTSKLFDYALPLQIQLEWLLKEKKADDWQILPKAGDTMSYRKWLVTTPVYDSRMRLKLMPAGDRVPDSLEYNRFFNLVAENSNYLSLETNCDSVSASELRPGDLLIARTELGTTGRVFILLCVLVNKEGDRRFLIGTGGNPPCDFYIPLFHEDRNYPWLTLEELKELAPEAYPVRGFYRLRIPR